MILQKASVTKALYETGAFAVVRVPTVERGCEIAEGLIRGGVHAMEISYTLPNAGEVIAGIKEKFGDQMIVGAGTVMVPWAVIDLFTGNLGGAIRLMVIWGLIALFRRVGEPKFVGDQTGLSPILSLVSIYVGMRLGGVLGMIFGPTVLLIALNLVKLGLFDGVRADAEAAVEDVIAILRERPESE